MGRKIRYYRNETTDPRLVKGKLYTMHVLAKLVKQSPTTIRSRVGTGDTVTDEHFISKKVCLLYTSPSPRDRTRSRMPSSA